MATASGFSKREMYEEMEKSLRTKDFETLCCIAVELLCTSVKEFKQVLSRITDFISQRIGLKDISILLKLSKLSEKCQTLLKGGKSVLKDAIFHDTLCQVLYIGVHCTDKEPRDLFDKGAAYNLEITAETKSYDGNIVKEFGRHIEAFSLILDTATWRNVCVLLNAVAEHDKRMILFMMAKLTCHKLGDSVNFGEISHLPTGKTVRADIVWVLWKALLNYSRSLKDGFPIVKACFDAYICNYSKKARMARSNLIYLAALQTSLGRACVEVDTGVYPIVQEASKKIAHVFDDVLRSTSRYKPFEPKTGAQTLDEEYDALENEVPYESAIDWRTPRQRLNKKKGKKGDKKKKITKPKDPTEEMPTYLRCIPYTKS